MIKKNRLEEENEVGGNGKIVNLSLKRQENSKMVKKLKEERYDNRK